MAGLASEMDSEVAQVTEEQVVCAFLWTGAGEGTAYGNGLVKVVRESVGIGPDEGASHALNQMA
jgi:hypothetical protein